MPAPPLPPTAPQAEAPPAFPEQAPMEIFLGSPQPARPGPTLVRQGFRNFNLLRYDGEGANRAKKDVDLYKWGNNYWDAVLSQIYAFVRSGDIKYFRDLAIPYARHFVDSQSIFAYSDIQGVPQKALPDYGNLQNILG